MGVVQVVELEGVVVMMANVGEIIVIVGVAVMLMVVLSGMGKTA